MSETTKKPICFVTNVYDHQYYSLGAYYLERSAKYFHPEIPFFVLGTKWIDEVGGGLAGTWIPQTLEKFIDEYQWVVRIDADCIITGRLEELLARIAVGESDILGVRNNNDYGKAGIDDALVQASVEPHRYLNAGLIATQSKGFIARWKQDNELYAPLLPFSEQSVLNALQRVFPIEIIDTASCGYYYGTSGLWGNGGEDQSHWDSWRQIEVNEAGDLMLRGGKVKILHHAGGKKEYKLGLHMFSEAARKRLVEIIGL